MARGRPRTTDDALLKSAELIGWALGGLEREIVQTRQRLNTLMTQAAALRKKLGRAAARAGASSADVASRTARKAARGRRKMSAEARKRISELMRQRWAERKKKGLKRL